MLNQLILKNEKMRQMIGITKIKDHYKFKCLLKKYHPNIPNNKLDELIFSINNNNFIWYILCEKNKIRSISEYCDLFIKSSKHMKQNQFEFKPFDKVLVRNTEEQTWKPNFYSFEGYNNSGYVCTNDMKYAQCIPYNENTAHLIGTNKPYEEPEPKVWRVKNVNIGEICELTQNEFDAFAKGLMKSVRACYYSIQRIDN